MNFRRRFPCMFGSSRLFGAFRRRVSRPCAHEQASASIPHSEANHVNMPRQLRYTENQKQLFTPGMPMRTAANMLLSHIKGSRDARGAWTEQRGTHQWPAIVQKDCNLRDSSTFLSHRVVTTPDTRNREACTITVHQFIIHPGVAEDITPALCACGAKKYAGACGIIVGRVQQHRQR